MLPIKDYPVALCVIFACFGPSPKRAECQARTIKTVQRVDAPGLAFETIAVDDADFSLEHLSRLGRQWIEKHRSARLQVLRVFSSERLARPYPRPSHLGYEGWARLNMLLGKEEWKVCEIVSSEGRSMLRLRDGQSVTRKLLEGDSDPLIPGQDCSNCEIAHIAFEEARGFSNRTVVLHIFVVAETLPDRAAGARVMEKMKVDIDPRIEVVSFSTRPWFVEDELFPVYFWFNVGGIPDRSEYDSVQTLTCSITPNGPRCL